MKLEIVRQYQVWVPGDIVDVGKGVADILLARGTAKPYEEKKKRGRPRKEQ